MILPTILATIQIANSVESLLGQKGYSTSALLNIRAETLKNISIELGTIHKEAITVIKEIENLQKFVGEVPDKNVLTLYQKILKGKFGRFREIYEEYKLRLEKDEIKRVIKDIKPSIISDLLAPIQEIRSILLNWNNSSDTPLISYCLEVEITSMLLVKTNSAKIKAALKSYKSWFENLMSGTNPQSLQNKYLQARQKQNDLINKANKIYYVSKCVVEKSEEIDSEPIIGPRPPQYKVTTQGTVKCKKFGFDKDFLVKTTDYKEIDLLVNSGTLNQDELPCKLKLGKLIIEKDVYCIFESTPKDTSMNIKPLLNDKDIPSNETSSNLLSRYPDCSKFTDTTTETAESIAISKDLEENGYLLLTLGSLVLAGNESLIAINKFLNDPLLKK